LERIDLRWLDLRHEGGCRLLTDGVDIRIIQLMLGHASIQQTQRSVQRVEKWLRGPATNIICSCGGRERDATVWPI